MVTTWLFPSGLSNVIGACDPAPLMQRNFDLIVSTHPVVLEPVAGVGMELDAEEAAALVQANFNEIADTLGLTLYPVANAADPEVCCQANFEIINANW